MDGCHNPSDWRCGDKCLSSEGICNCIMHNRTSQIRFNDGRWCCQSISNECTLEYKYHYVPMIVNCIGTSIPLTQQCLNEETQSSTCNFYPEDQYRNFLAIRSYIDV